MSQLSYELDLLFVCDWLSFDYGLLCWPLCQRFFLKDTITPQKGALIRLNHIISGRCLENIIKVMSYTNITIPEFNDPFFRQMQMQEGLNKNMAAYFDPSWVGVLDESIQECINCYTFPECMVVPHKPHPFGN